MKSTLLVMMILLAELKKTVRFHGRPNKGFMDWKGDPVRFSREMIPVIHSLLYFVFLRSKSFSPCEISSFAWSIRQPPSIACDRLGLNKTSKIINLRYILKAKNICLKFELYHEWCGRDFDPEKCLKEFSCVRFVSQMHFWSLVGPAKIVSAQQIHVILKFFKNFLHQNLDRSRMINGLVDNDRSFEWQEDRSFS